MLLSAKTNIQGDKMKKALCTLLTLTLIFGILFTFTVAFADENNDDSDCSLSAISVNCGKLDPEFTSDNTKYTLYIPSDLTQVIITPTPASKSATSSKIDITLAKEQEPTIAVICSAQNGDKNEYKLKIKRIDKTLAEIQNEIEQNGYAVYVKETKFYQNKDVIFTVSFVILGIIILAVLYLITHKKLIKPYDGGEKPFYKKQ